MDLMVLLEKLSVPRPGHSPALEQTATMIRELLSNWNIPFTEQVFPLRYHQNFLMGLSILILSGFFALFILRRKPLPAFIAVAAIVLMLILEVEFSVPTVSALIRKPTENIIITHTVPDAARELIFTAHYDSKTDLWDHIQRSYIQKLFPFFLVLCLLLCLWAFLANRMAVLRLKRFRLAAWLLTASYVIYAGFAFSWLGGYMFMDEHSQSFGSIDDGASVLVLLAVAKDIREGQVNTGDSSITILLTSGEETGLHGARWYVKQRYDNGRIAPPRPTALISLELIGQNGNLYYATSTSSGLIRSFKSDPDLAERLDQVWQGMTGNPMTVVSGGINDAFPFLAAGIPSLTIGHDGNPGGGFGGFHSTRDNMARANPANIALGIRVLEKFIESYRPQPADRSPGSG
ncbi:MAG: M20/M25/M40 family metallo-hydrolase [bacterium]